MSSAACSFETASAMLLQRASTEYEIGSTIASRGCEGFPRWQNTVALYSDATSRSGRAGLSDRQQA